jgi:VWFA-related protein
MVESMNNRLLMSALLLFSLVVNLQGQQPQPQPSSQPSQLPKQTTVAPQKSPNGQDQDVVRITTKLVQVDVVVVTKDGKQVTDLKAEDFEISEDGRAQTITNFSYISNIPAAAASRPAPVPVSSDPTGPPVVPAPVSAKEVRRTIAIVVDDLGTSFESMARVRNQLRKFLNEQLQPNDLVAIIRTGGEIGALQQFTTDRRVLLAAIESLKWNHCSRAGRAVLEPARPFDFANDNPCATNSLHNTITALRFILRGMRDLPGRKSMIILADNLPTEQKELFDPNSIIKGKGREGQKLPIKYLIGNTLQYADAFQGVAELAIRASVVIYGVDVGGLQTTGLNAADEVFQPQQFLVKAGTEPTIVIMRDRFQTLRKNREAAELLASQTGGFVVHNTNEFELQRVMDDQQGYYLIGYRPSGETFNRSFHHIQARVKRAGLTVRTRSGFYGVTEEQARAAEINSGDQMNRALMSPFGTGDLPVRLTTFFVNDPTAGSLLRSLLFLDAHDLTFKEQADGTHEAAFDLSSIVFGDNGAVIDRIDKSATLRLRGAPYDRVMREGVIYGFDTPVKEAGTFQFRIAVRDTTSSRVGVAGQFAEIPNLANDRLALSGIVVKTDENPRSERPANDPATIAADGITRGPAVRRFHQGATLIFGYEVYNARVDRTTGLPQLRARMRIFREGKPIFIGNPTALDGEGQRDLRHLNGAARFQLGPELPPGEYVLQIIVDDNLAKDKQRTATQWIDFEVVR